MKDEIKEAQRSHDNNGRMRQSDMLWYIINKVDNIGDKLDKKVDKKVFMWIVGILFILFVSLMSVTIAGR